MRKSQTAASPNIRALTETALLVAVAFILSFFRYGFAYGGSVTPASMLPILMIGMRRGPVWGLGGALVYSGLQMLQGFQAPPAASVLNFALVILLDYVGAFTVLGAAGFFSKKKNGILYAVPLCLTLRFLCHFTSGIIIWGQFAWEGFPVWLYSFCYNGIYMGIELILCMAAALGILKKSGDIFSRQG